MMHHNEWFAPAIGAFDKTMRPTWWLRRCFTLETVLAAFTVDVVCLGYYELYVNGKQVGDEPLAPSISKLDKRAFVCHHDITPYVSKGRNCMVNGDARQTLRFALAAGGHEITFDVHSNE